MGLEPRSHGLQQTLPDVPPHCSTGVPAQRGRSFTSLDHGTRDSEFPWAAPDRDLAPEPFKACQTVSLAILLSCSIVRVFQVGWSDNHEDYIRTQGGRRRRSIRLSRRSRTGEQREDSGKRSRRSAPIS